MSEIEGKLVTCDVCGKSVFLPYVGDGESDGGFTRWRRYEKLPKGWNDVRASVATTTCPDCSERINKALDSVIDDIREESNGRD